MGLYDVKSGNVPSARAKLQELKGLGASIGEKEKSYNQMASTHLEREILLAEGDFDGALKVFAAGPPIKIDVSMPVTVQSKNLPYFADFAARVHVKKGARDLAIKEYERLVSPKPEIREGALIHPFSRLRLAALYEAKGDLDKAAEQYRILGTIWGQADPALPEVITVRKKAHLYKGRMARPGDETVDVFFELPFIGTR
jgi:tetratricopeptide (TPR) repeat protein